MRKEKFDFDDIMIQPSVVSDIDSRQHISIRDENGMLPLFAAPMDTVVDLTNYKLFLKNGIRVVLPRTISPIDLPYKDNSEYLWFSYGLNEIEELFLDNYNGELSRTHIRKVNQISEHLKTKTLYILIDVANGHMKRMHEQVKALKDKYGDKIQIMVGNIANAETYKLLSELGVWGIRCGIGGGSGCHYKGTKVKTNIGYKNIEDLKIGDFVLTHKGNYKEIEFIHILKSDDNYKINDNYVTGNHEYYVVNKKYKDMITDNNIHEYAEWISVDRLTKDYYLLEME